MCDCLATTDMGWKVGETAVPLPRGAGSPSNTMWPGLTPTSIPSGILIHPTVLPQHTNVRDRTDRQDRQRSDSIEQTVLQTVAQKLNLNQHSSQRTTHMCVRINVQNCSDNLPSYLPDNQHSSDDVYWRRGGEADEYSTYTAVHVGIWHPLPLPTPGHYHCWCCNLWAGSCKCSQGTDGTCDFSTEAVCRSHIGLMSMPCSRSRSPWWKNSCIMRSVHCR